MATKLRRFSHSLVDTMLDCSRKAYYRYVEEIPSPKSSALVKGSACDEAWNVALSAKVDGDVLSLTDTEEITEQKFRDEVANEGGVSAIDWGDDDDPKASARASLDAAIRLTRTWHKDLYPLIEPTLVQIELHRPLPSGRDFIGFLDFEGTVDGREVVADNKTASRAMPASDADKALQAYAYAWLKDEPIDFAFVRAIETKGGRANSEIVFTRRSDGDIEWYGELVATVEQQFEAGMFPPNPKSFLCSRKLCPYFERCQPHRVISGPSPQESQEE